MTETLTPDICVIGAGSGGLSVAAAAAAFGVSVVLLEKGKMGGDCLNYGCVPSKAMIAAGKIAETFRQSEKFGIKPQEPEVDFQKVHDHVHGVIAAIAPNDSVERFTGLGVKVITEAGYFQDQKTVVAGKYKIKARRFVVSTGSSAFVPPIPGIEAVSYLTNETLFEATERPEHLVVIGGGPIGMEMAQAHRRLGSKVTVIEMFTAFGKDDPELTSIALDEIRREGVDIREKTKTVRLLPGAENGVEVIVEKDGKEETIAGSHLLLATGRAANVSGLDLEKAGIEYSRKGIVVDAKMRTTNKRVYAIGDVAGGLQFTHVAGYHAGLVIRSILFRMGAKEKTNIIPWVTFTDPEVSHVGLGEEAAREQHKDIKILRWPYVENDRAQAERKTTGLIKVITNKKGKILGATIVGQNAGEMINIWALAVTQGMKVGAMTGYIPPYPTMTEIGKRASTEYYKPSLQNPWIRRVIGFLRIFG
ncbi:MAG: FAD-dependent oxidoreductase [Hyphomicrobiales bacterium]